MDSIKAQALNSSPAPRLRPVGDDESPRKPPDLYSHVYDHISAELHTLKQKTSALSLNGTRRSSKSTQGEGPQEHIYDEPEGCAKGKALPKTIYEQASAPSAQEWESLDKQPSPPQGPSRGLALGLKWPKPLPAPKPGRPNRKEPTPPSGKHPNVNNNNNSVWVGEGGDLYSKVSKQKPLHSCYSQQHQGLRPDIIYDNLGNI